MENEREKKEKISAGGHGKEASPSDSPEVKMARALVDVIWRAGYIQGREDATRETLRIIRGEN